MTRVNVSSKSRLLFDRDEKLPYGIDLDEAVADLFLGVDQIVHVEHMADDGLRLAFFIASDDFSRKDGPSDSSNRLS